MSYFIASPLNIRQRTACTTLPLIRRGRREAAVRLYDGTLGVWLSPSQHDLHDRGRTGFKSGSAQMKVSKTRKATSWTDVKARLTHFDHDGLVGLLHDLYTASKDNQIFLHARFELNEDVLEPYKTSINRWLWPDMFRNRNASVAEAKMSIANYKRAIGRPEGLAELMVFYCERASGFSVEVGLQDEGFFSALVRMFEQALQAIARLPDAQRPLFMERLRAVRRISQNIGYGVEDAMRDLLVEYGPYD
jgi:hypothetical protein